MITGFCSVPFFKFAAPHLPGGVYFEALAELPPSFLLAGIVAVVVSMLDKSGRERLVGIESDLGEVASLPPEKRATKALTEIS